MIFPLLRLLNITKLDLPQPPCKFYNFLWKLIMIYFSKAFFSFSVEGKEVQVLVLDGAWEGGKVERGGIGKGFEEKEEEL